MIPTQTLRRLKHANACLWLLSLPLLFALACNNEVKVTSTDVESSGATLFALDLSIIKPADEVIVSGKNFTSDMTVRVDGLDGQMQMLTPDTAKIIIPDGVRSGKIDIKFYQADKEIKTFSVFSSRLGIAAQMATFPPAMMCSDTTYIGEDGSTISGTRDCSAVSSETTTTTNTESVAPVVVPDCTTDGQTNCIAKDNFKAARTCTDSGSNCYLPTYALTTQPLKAINYALLSPAVIKSGETIAGVTGAYPSASHPLATNDAFADITATDFNTKVSTAAIFAWFDRNGTRHSKLGTTDLASGNILNGKSIFGANGNIVLPAAWDVRSGTSFGSAGTGKLKVNCRNAANLTQVNFGPTQLGGYLALSQTAYVFGHNFTEGTPVRVSQGIFLGMDLNDRDTYYVTQISGDNFKLAETLGGNTYRNFGNTARTDLYFSKIVPGTADAYDNLFPAHALTQNPWNDSSLVCGGLETASEDSNVWKNVSSDPNFCTGGGACRFQDKISGLQWTKSFAQASWAVAASTCQALTYDGVTGWRLPSLYEWQEASIHGITSVPNNNWISSSDLDSFLLTLTNTTDDVAFWAYKASNGLFESSWKNAAERRYSCVK